MSNMYNNQKIQCNVTKCSHNCVDDSTCRLEKIKVCVCQNQGSGEADDETACGSYDYSGDLNVEEITGRD